MKAPTTILGRPGRAAATLGAVVAVSAAGAMALVAGTAAADEPGRCTDNVNVRAEPDITSQIVALCEAGTEVQTGEIRDGFIQLTDLGGWAHRDYIAIDGPVAPAQDAPAPDDGEQGGSEGSGFAGDNLQPTPGPESSSGDFGDGDFSDYGQPQPAPEPEPSPLGGLLG
ncbi:SH3 domain-containing protein [Pseudonocardia nigra]|uniref:SH3 domain-containing protein n=1 Tax=Pseudonocardia nigra TaxID=1921578 RepID=UPI001C5E48CF|nr:SH3 domain-containing protein [Pseudonocardia nigra]